MNDEEYGKKLVEEKHLFQFLAAYEVATGTALNLESRHESPDFICTHQSGDRIGIELTRSPHDYEMRVHDRIWTESTCPSFDLLAAISTIIATKEHKRRTYSWPDTILVVELFDYSFESLHWTNDNTRADDFSDTGFREIWLADHSTVEAYGVVRLIGLYPKSIFGLHYQPALEGKPYG